MTASHNSVWSFLFGLPFERALAYHKVFAYMSLPVVVWHAIVSHANASGLLFGLLMVLIFIQSFYMIRRHYFETFYKLHWVLFVLVAVVAVAHGAGLLLIGAAFWLLDALYRYLFMTMFRLPRKATFQVLPANVVRVTFPKPANFHYRGGQYMFVCVPGLTLFQFHPFSISSSPNSPNVTLHIRTLGDWTKALLNFVATKAKQQQKGTTASNSDIVEETSSCELDVLLEGPYGSPMVDLDSERYKLFVLISGGIGITPMQSICNDLIDQNKRGRPIKKIFFVWTVRDRQMIDAVYDANEAAKASPGRLPSAFTPDVLERHSTAPGSLMTPNSIDPTNDREVLHTEFFMTKMRRESMPHVQDHMKSFLRFDRPSLPTIFDSLHAFASAQKTQDQSGAVRVAVLVCGPPSLISETRDMCHTKARDGVVFDFHGETFEF
eukprot:c10977_g1_i1.p1 GENE.c10977_g1_i1~~c10977_g1_i1.p1  ORF type:complete len:436 (-),score=92.38 c10977_g1_i1:197-1504(-)